MGELEKYSILSVAALLVLFFVLAFVGRDAVEDGGSGSEALLAGGHSADSMRGAPSDDVLPLVDATNPRNVDPASHPRRDDTRTLPPPGATPSGGGTQAVPLLPGGAPHETSPTPPPEPKPEPPKSVDAPIVHTIQAGDTLIGLAKRYLGDGKLWTAIQDANPGVDPSRLKIGQEIKIPARGSLKSGVMNEPPRRAGFKSGGLESIVKPPPGGESGRGVALAKERVAKNGKAAAARTYTVKSGDSLSKIAQSYYGDPLAYKRILDANKGVVKDPAVLTEGMVLVIP